MIKNYKNIYGKLFPILFYEKSFLEKHVNNYDFFFSINFIKSMYVNMLKKGNQTM